MSRLRQIISIGIHIIIMTSWKSKTPVNIKSLKAKFLNSAEVVWLFRPNSLYMIPVKTNLSYPVKRNVYSDILSSGIISDCQISCCENGLEPIHRRCITPRLRANLFHFNISNYFETAFVIMVSLRHYDLIHCHEWLFQISAKFSGFRKKSSFR